MATSAEARAAGFVTPSSTDLLTNGDDAITANAIATLDHTASALESAATNALRRRNLATENLDGMRTLGWVGYWVIPADSWAGIRGSLPFPSARAVTLHISTPNGYLYHQRATDADGREVSRSWNGSSWSAWAGPTGHYGRAWEDLSGAKGSTVASHKGIAIFRDAAAVWLMADAVTFSTSGNQTVAALPIGYQPPTQTIVAYRCAPAYTTTGHQSRMTYITGGELKVYDAQPGVPYVIAATWPCINKAF